jgi:hypothetical protein
VGRDVDGGFAYLIDMLRASPFPEIALELENQRAIEYFKVRTDREREKREIDQMYDG